VFEEEGKHSSSLTREGRGGSPDGEGPGNRRSLNAARAADIGSWVVDVQVVLNCERPLERESLRGGRRDAQGEKKNRGQFSQPC